MVGQGEGVQFLYRLDLHYSSDVYILYMYSDRHISKYPLPKYGTELPVQIRYMYLGIDIFFFIL